MTVAVSHRKVPMSIASLGSAASTLAQALSKQLQNSASQTSANAQSGATSATTASGKAHHHHHHTSSPAGGEASSSAVDLFA